MLPVGMDDRSISEREFMDRWRLELIAASDAAGEAGADTAEWLGLSKSAYYRRRRGEMPFTAYEFVLLSRRYGLDMHPAHTETPRFGFDAPLEADSSFSEKRYLSQLEGTAQLYGDGSEASALVSSTDIPIFYLFGEPDLAALKRYLFSLAIDAKGARKFVLAKARRDYSAFIGRTAAVARAYRNADREEAWGPSPLRSLTYQILLLVESAAIGREDCEALFDAINRVIDRLERSISGEDDQRLKLWQNRLHATSSIIQLSAHGVDRLYVTFDNPNFFVSADPKAVAYFTAHFEALRKRSLRIAGHGALSPARYASSLRRYVSKGRNKAMSVFGDLSDEL